MRGLLQPAKPYFRKRISQRSCSIWPRNQSISSLEIFVHQKFRTLYFIRQLMPHINLPAHRMQIVLITILRAKNSHDSSAWFTTQQMQIFNRIKSSEKNHRYRAERKVNKYGWKIFERLHQSDQRTWNFWDYWNRA